MSRAALPGRRNSSTKDKRANSAHSCWRAMHYRCRCRIGYVDRGICVIKRWNSFASFLADMGPRPSLQYTIERKNNDRGYTKSNCIWATKAVQNRNKTTTNIHLGCSVAEWADKLGLKYHTVWRRVFRYRHGEISAKDVIEPGRLHLGR